MSASQRRKGRAGEQEIVNLAKEHGLEARRTWQTATSPDPAIRCCDVEIGGRVFQVKRRGRAWADLYDALRNVDGVFCRADGKPWIVVLTAENFFRR